jgi:signal recognition particle GTPase
MMPEPIITTRVIIPEIEVAFSKMFATHQREYQELFQAKLAEALTYENLSVLITQTLNRELNRLVADEVRRQITHAVNKEVEAAIKSALNSREFQKRVSEEVLHNLNSNRRQREDY